MKPIGLPGTLALQGEEDVRLSSSNAPGRAEAAWLAWADPDSVLASGPGRQSKPCSRRP